MVMSPAGLETKNDCAGGGVQHFNPSEPTQSLNGWLYGRVGKIYKVVEKWTGFSLSPVLFIVQKNISDENMLILWTIVERNFSCLIYIAAYGLNSINVYHFFRFTSLNMNQTLPCDSRNKATVFFIRFFSRSLLAYISDSKHTARKPSTHCQEYRKFVEKLHIQLRT
jgi:hypothetical protein